MYDPTKDFEEFLYGERKKRERKPKPRAKRRPKNGLYDRRRFTEALPARGTKPLKVAPPDATGTMYPGYVQRWNHGTGETILKDGRHNRKIGGDVLNGPLRGGRIFTLSLEERKTCPRHCFHWQTCYGNAMPRSRRWEYTPMLLFGLAGEVRRLCCTNKVVLIRLHVLGDFPDREYIRFWEEQLELWPNLILFGFTAHKQHQPLGKEIVRVRGKYLHRFAIRHSGQEGKWGSHTIAYETKGKKLGRDLVCPEQRHANKPKDDPTKKPIHCGNCMACVFSDVGIVFMQH